MTTGAVFCIFPIERSGVLNSHNHEKRNLFTDIFIERRKDMIGDILPRRLTRTPRGVRQNAPFKEDRRRRGIRGLRYDKGYSSSYFFSQGERQHSPDSPRKPCSHGY